MVNPKTILLNDPSIPEELDFNFLREKGVEYLTQLSGQIWTDFNLHDPGITILEVLCFALSDLGYRNQLPIEDILALPKDRLETEDNFFTPATILTNNPLTILDYRKLLIDIEGVKNAWIEPTYQGQKEIEPTDQEQEETQSTNQEQEVELFVNCHADPSRLEFENPDEAYKPLYINGLYKVFIELDSVKVSRTGSAKSSEKPLRLDDVLTEIQERLHCHRNLCEDFYEITVLDEEEIGLCAAIELEAKGEPQAVLTEIFIRLQDFLSPTLDFFSIQEMLDRGKCLDEIFAGRPLLKDPFQSNGFIDVDQLKGLELRRELHTSDFYRVIMGIPGVKAVKSLGLINFIDDIQLSQGEEWCLKLSEGHKPVLSLAKSKITFSKGPIILGFDRDAAVEQAQERLSNITKAKVPQFKLDLPVPIGQYRPDLGDYHSIQNDFPLVYAIGEGEMPDNASELRKAQGLQLKGYLLFFDQILANYLAQLSHIRELFSLTPDGERLEMLRELGASAVLNTYFSQGLDSVPDIQKLIFFHDLDSKQPYPDGEIIADPVGESVFGTQQQRDRYLEVLVTMFQNKEVRIEIASIDGTYKFQFLDGQDRVLLKSRETFTTEKAAREQAELFDFLGTLPETYQKVNDPANAEYTFRIVYYPVSYMEYLGRITEDRQVYHERRDAFLDHLLARFAEDFTDYVLLMNALFADDLPELLTPEKIIDDKAHFLSCYPEISRNRGRAYNYTLVEELWDSDNVSGMEQKVSKLMGLRDFHRHSLANFKIAYRETKWKLVLCDPFGQILLETLTQYDSEQDALDNLNVFVDLFSDPGRYRNDDCVAIDIFGFYLVDDQDKPFAVHPRSYSSRSLRDKRRKCIFSFLQQCGYLHEARLCPRPIHFQLLDDEGEPLFTSVEGYERDEEALAAWDYFLFLLRSPENYHYQMTGDNCTLFIQNAAEPSTAPVATMIIEDCDNAEEILENLIEKYCDKALNCCILEKNGLYKIQLEDRSGDVLFRGTRVYDSEEEALYDCYWFIELACQKAHYCRVGDQDGFSFVLQEGEETVMVHPWMYDTPKERDQCLKYIRHYITDNKCSLDLVCRWCAYLLWMDCDGDCSPVLESILQFDSESDAAAIFQDLQLLEVLRDGGMENWYCEEAPDGGGHYVILALDGIPVFRSVNFYESEAACELALGAIRNYYDEVFRCSQINDDDPNAPFVEVDWACKVKLECVQGNDGDFDCDAERIKQFVPCDEYDDCTEDPTNPNANIYGFSVGFRVIRDDYRIADHPINYSSSVERDEALCTIFEKAACREAPYQPYQYFCQVRQREDRLFYFQIRYGVQVLWESLTGFSSRTEAENRCEEIWFSAFAAGKLEDNYRREEDRIYLTDESGEDLLVMLLLALDDEDFQAAVEYRIESSTLYPIVYNQEVYHFELHDPNTGQLLWRSDRTYPTLREAIKAYREFLGLLTYKPNYRTINDDQACLFSFQLGEVLLESQKPSREVIQLLPEEQLDKDECLKNLKVWGFTEGGVNEFLRYAQKEQAIYPFIDYRRSCDRSFWVVDADFRVAGHTQFYHTLAEREAAIDQLHQKWLCGDISFSCVEPKSCCIGEDLFLLVKDKDSENIYWRSYFRNAACNESNQDGLNTLFREFMLHLMNYAREPDFYSLFKNEAGKYRALIEDEHSQALAYLYGEFDTIEELLGRIEEAILFARRFPITKLDEETFTFQVYCEDDQETTYLLNNPEVVTAPSCSDEVELTLSGSYIWKGKKYFSSYGAVALYVDSYIYFCNYFGCNENDPAEMEVINKRRDKAISLLADKINYQRPDQNDCGPFTIELTDPQGIWGRHPRTYSCREDLDAAIEKTKSAINAEGFHLVEHVLLRPKIKERKFETVCFEDDMGCRRNFFLGFLTNEEAARVALETLEEITMDQFMESFLFSMPPRFEESRNVLPGRILELDLGALIDRTVLEVWNDELPWALLGRILNPLSGVAPPDVSRFFPVFERWLIDEYPALSVDELLGAARSLIKNLALNTLSGIPNFELALRALIAEKVGPPLEPDSIEFGAELKAMVLRVQSLLLFITRKNPRLREVNEKSFVQFFKDNLNLDTCTIISPGHKLLPVNVDCDGNCIDDCEGGIKIKKTFPFSDPCISGADEVVCVDYLPGGDPYSFWITIVLPYWPERYQNTDFRAFLAQTLRMETPAHIALRICWIDPCQMARFEEKYRAWLSALSGAEGCNFDQAQCDMVTNLLSLNNIYNPSILVDCANITTSSATVLDKSTLT